MYQFAWRWHIMIIWNLTLHSIPCKNIIYGMMITEFCSLRHSIKLIRLGNSNQGQSEGSVGSFIFVCSHWLVVSSQLSVAATTEGLFSGRAAERDWFLETLQSTGLCLLVYTHVLSGSRVTFSSRSRRGTHETIVTFSCRALCDVTAHVLFTYDIYS